jgi:hypothetical protein
MSRRAILFIVALVLCGYGVWSLYVESRYQALCELSYWSASAPELRLCEERLTELNRRQ